MQKLALLGGESVISHKQKLSQMFVQYPFVERFTDYVGARYGVTTSNGTSSLISALIGAGVGPGDEVLTVSYTWYSTVTSILAVNAIPVFVDIDKDTFSMNPALIEKQITSRTKAILAVSVYGQPADYEKILPIARKHNLVVIDDACQSLGASIGEQKLGNIADITAFSFSGKPIVSTGGGIVTTNNELYYERTLQAGQHPSDVSTKVQDDERWKLSSTGGYGFNMRIDGKCMERAYEKLEELDMLNAYRRQNAHYLTEKLQQHAGIKPPQVREGAYHIYHIYTCLFDEMEYGITRDEFVDAINAEGVPAIKYVSMVNFLKTPTGEPFYAGPIHKRYLFTELSKKGRVGSFQIPEEIRPNYLELDLPVTDRVTDTEFNIPQRWLNPPFSRKQMDLYIQAIDKVLSHSQEIIKNRDNAETWKRKPIFLTVDKSDR